VVLRLSEGLGPTVRPGRTGEGDSFALCAGLKPTALPVLAAAQSESTEFLTSSSRCDAGIFLFMLSNTTTAAAGVFAPQALRCTVLPGARLSRRDLSGAR
jgi:hypothetical protein